MTVSNEHGFSLIETLAALTVFAVITVGVVPLLGSSLRGSALSRSYTIGKDLALQGMERARGMPYYVAFQSQPKPVDILDLYFPCADPNEAASGCLGEGVRSYDSTTKIFSITCDDDDSGPSCAIPLTAGYSVRYDARFVRTDGATTEPPQSTYVRNPGPTQGSLDSPPTQLIELTVTALWDAQGEPRSFVLQSLIGAREFGPIKMAGLARVSYGVQVLTSYKHTAGDSDTSDLKALAGTAEARFQTRLVSTARQSIRAAEVSLVRRPSETETEAEHLGISPLQGAVSEPESPPDQAPTDVASPPAISAPAVMEHPNLLTGDEIASLFTTNAEDVTTSVAGELPSATGGFSFAPASGETSSAGYFWVTNQTDAAQNALLQLDLVKKVFSLKTQANETMEGTTSISTTGLGAGRKVEATAEAEVKLIRALPATYLTSGSQDERQIVIIKDFTAELDCIATGDLATSEATGSWSATVKVWFDGDGVNNGTTVPTSALIAISGDLAATETSFRAILGDTVLQASPAVQSDNPLILDSLLPTNDVYLFDDLTTNGYLTDFTISPVVTAVELDGALARGGIEGAIHIATVPTNPVLPESGLNISVGSLNCEALDQR